MSSAIGRRSKKFAAYVFLAYEFQSHEKTQSQPADSKPRRIPPIPQKRSTNLSLRIIFARLHVTANHLEMEHRFRSGYPQTHWSGVSGSDCPSLEPRSASTSRLLAF